MISLPWLLKHQTFPVKTSSVPRRSNFPTAKRQCLSCSVKLHLNIYLVCYLSNLSQRRYIYCIYLYPQGFHVPILCTLISYASGLSPGMSKVKMLFWKHPLTHVLTPTPTPRLRSTRRLSTFCHHLPSKEKHARRHYWSHNPFPAEFFYDHIRPASGPRSRRWRLRCYKQCSAVTYPPCHPSCDTQQKINV